MRARARRSAFSYSDDFLPGERIGPPLAGRGRALLRGGIVLSLAFGAGWLIVSDPATWPKWLPKELAAVSRWLEAAFRSEPKALATVAAPSTRARSELAARPPSFPAPSSIAAPAPIEAQVPPIAAARTEAPPLTTASLPAPAATAAAPQEPQGPPSVDPSDPYQIRAAEVGLHPDLSRVLLARLSPTDYKNAGIAIQTALAETPDTGVYVWPRQRKPELALFKVHFVAGAAPGCRRYVVTVVKDGWLTTASPMEKCGAEAVRARASPSKRAEKP